MLICKAHVIWWYHKIFYKIRINNQCTHHWVLWKCDKVCSAAVYRNLVAFSVKLAVFKHQQWPRKVEITRPSRIFVFLTKTQQKNSIYPFRQVGTAAVEHATSYRNGKFVKLRANFQLAATTPSSSLQISRTGTPDASDSSPPDRFSTDELIERSCVVTWGPLHLPVQRAVRVCESLLLEN